jgi:hypothetical protein
MVEFLLEQRNLRPSDLWPVIGSKSRVSEILAGKRSISKEQAKKLANSSTLGPICLSDREFENSRGRQEPDWRSALAGSFILPARTA